MPPHPGCPGWFYEIDGSPNQEDNEECIWPESDLKKKYPPSTESFDQLLQGLKRPQGVVV
jgi:hypothetical protein